MDDINKGDIITCVFNIDSKNIFVKVEFIGEYSSFEDEQSFYFANTKTGVEYSFTKSQILSFAEASNRHEIDTITFTD